MQQETIFPFMAQHWLLIIFALVLVAAIISYERLNKPGAGSTISAQEVVRFINDDAIVLDLRGRDLYRKGHIINAKHFPMDTLKQDLDKLGAYKDKVVILVCGDGLTSIKALQVLKDSGVWSLKVLSGGMRAWHEASLPVEKG